MQVTIALSVNRGTEQSAVSKEIETLAAPVKEVLKDAEKELLKGKTLVQCNAEFVEQHGSSLKHRVAAAEMLRLLAPSTAEATVAQWLSDLSGIHSHHYIQV